MEGYTVETGSDGWQLGMLVFIGLTARYVPFNTLITPMDEGIHTLSNISNSITANDILNIRRYGLQKYLVASGFSIGRFWIRGDEFTPFQ